MISANTMKLELTSNFFDFSKKIKERKWTKKQKEKSPLKKEKMVTQFSEPSSFQFFSILSNKKTLSTELIGFPIRALEKVLEPLLCWLGFPNRISLSYLV